MQSLGEVLGRVDKRENIFFGKIILDEQMNGRINNYRLTTIGRSKSRALIFFKFFGILKKS